jgi:hypothetical protein
VSDNASLTFDNIVSDESLFRQGIMSGLICYTLFLFLPIVLHKLFKQVNEGVANLMVLLAVVNVPIYFTNIQNEFAVLSLVSGATYLNGFSVEQIQSQVLFHLEQYDNGMRVIHIFSGLWLFPFGYLVLKSGFLPKVLGIFLMVGCFGYLINFIGGFLFHNYADIGIARFVSLPASIGEIGICLWLLIIGIRDKRTP